MPTLPKNFSDVEIGDELGPVTFTPTTEIVQRFAATVQLRDQRFINPDVAQQRGFQQPIVPGPLSATFLSRMVTDHFPGWRLRAFHVSFRAPVRHGEALTCWGTVTEKGEQDGVATIHCDVVAENANGDRAIVGTAMLHPRLPRR